MLTDAQIERYIYTYTKLYEDYVYQVLLVIAKRLGANNHVDASVFSLDEAFKVTRDKRTIEKLTADFKKQSLDNLTEDLFEIASFVYWDCDVTETKTHFINNSYIYQPIKALVTQKVNEFAQLIDKPIFIANGKHYNPADFYQTSIYRALLGKTGRDTMLVTRPTLKFILSASPSFEYNFVSDNTKRVTNGITAVRGRVLENIKETISKVVSLLLAQSNADGIEISAHMFPAPDHAPVQGHQFAIEEFDKMQVGADFEDIQGRHYIGFPRPLMAWNCRHYIRPIIIGKTKQEHTDEELQRILDDNERGYTTSDGKHYTLYECTQIQRGFERKIRLTKQTLELYKATEDNPSAREWKSKVESLTAQYKEFNKACGVPPRLGRINI